MIKKGNTYYELYYHVVFATKNREPFLSIDDINNIRKITERKADELGFLLHIINGYKDHIHILLTIPPVLSISNVVKHIKGTSSREIEHITWQEGYWLTAVEKRNVKTMATYIENQWQKHENQNQPEEWEDKNDPIIRQGIHSLSNENINEYVLKFNNDSIDFTQSENLLGLQTARYANTLLFQHRMIAFFYQNHNFDKNTKFTYEFEHFLQTAGLIFESLKNFKKLIVEKQIDLNSIWQTEENKNWLSFLDSENDVAKISKLIRNKITMHFDPIVQKEVLQDFEINENTVFARGSSSSKSHFNISFINDIYINYIIKKLKIIDTTNFYNKLSEETYTVLFKLQTYFETLTAYIFKSKMNKELPPIIRQGIHSLSNENGTKQ